jgi:hypothetical protein
MVCDETMKQLCLRFFASLKASHLFSDLLKAKTFFAPRKLQWLMAHGSDIGPLKETSDKDKAKQQPSDSRKDCRLSMVRRHPLMNLVRLMIPGDPLVLLQKLCSPGFLLPPTAYHAHKQQCSTSPSPIDLRPRPDAKNSSQW